MLTVKNGLMKQATHLKSYVTPAPDYRYLKEFIDQVGRAMARIEQAYRELNESINEAIKTTDDAAEACRSLAQKARLNQRKTALVGGVTTAVTAGAVSTMVGGPVGMGMAAGVGVVGGGITVTLAVKLECLARAFEVQYTTLNDWASCASQLKESAVDVHQAVDILAAAVDDLEHGQQSRESIESLCQNLNLLNVSFTEVSAESQKCRTTIQSAKETMETGLAKIT